MSGPPPVRPAQVASAFLAAEVKRKVRERGLVVWLDADCNYFDFVDALARGEHDFVYPVVTYRGSYLELMLAMEPYGSRLDRDHVLVHLPGINKDSVKETPVFELYEAGTLFEKALPTLVREAAVGLARPEQLESFVRAPKLSLESADEWLGGLSAEPRDQLTTLLENLGPDDVVIGLVIEDARLHPHLPDGGEAILRFLERNVGLGAEWRAFQTGEALLTASAMATLVAGFVMAVEFVHDLREPPVTPALQALTRLGAFARVCRRLATKLRREHPDGYEAFANEMQERLPEERTSHHADALGSIDTFRFEELTMRVATLEAIARGAWDDAVAHASARTTEQCFWVQRSSTLQRTWDLLRLAAATGQAIAAAKLPSPRAQSIEEVVEIYADRLAVVDRRHRDFEQGAHALIASDLEDYDALLDARRSVRRAYRDWADAVNRAFFDLCVARGPLPDRSLRQRALFEDEVAPLVDQGQRVAFVMVDALRFEMAQALAEELTSEGFAAEVRPRLAELPTQTVIGMNALAPVEKNGRLRLVQRSGKLAGFTTGEFVVSEPADRVRAIGQRCVAGKIPDLELEEFTDLELSALKRRLQAHSPLVVVRSRELDDAGEAGLHLGTFDHTLRLLRSAISLLSRAGIGTFVITSDHGFLLQDPTVDNVPFGVSKRVPERRHALLAEPSGMPDVLEVRLSALEYDVEEDGILVFRPDTAVWEVREKVAPFVHGGNSLQERVIPVLVVTRGIVRGKTLSKFEVIARPEPAHLGRQRLVLAVRLQRQQTATLGFVSPATVSLALRVNDRPQVALTLLTAGPPASLVNGRILVPPDRSEALVEFELEGEVDERVRIEVYHPDGEEEVTPKLVEGFFEVHRNRRLPKPVTVPPPAPPVVPPTKGATPPPPPEKPPEQRPDPAWTDLIEHEAYRRVLKYIAEHRTINETELQQMLGSPRRVRAFAWEFDRLVARLPFGIEVLTVNEMKLYRRKD